MEKEVKNLLGWGIKKAQKEDIFTDSKLHCINRLIMSSDYILISNTSFFCKYLVFRFNLNK